MSENYSCLCFEEVYSHSTDLKISSVKLDFRIDADGTYYCTFYGNIVGSNQTEPENSKGSFIIPDTTVRNFTFFIDENLLDLEKTRENESLVFSFSTNQSILENLQCRMHGSFYGNFQTNNSGICSYSLGIDWGTTVGEQTVIMRLKFREFNIIEVTPTYPPLQIVGEWFELQWFETMVQRYTAELKLQSTEISLSEILDITPTSPWNVTAGGHLEIKVKNLGLFDVEVFLITPSWITTNITKFYLEPNQEKELTFHISTHVSLGLNDSIQFLILYYSILHKQVIVTKIGPSNNLFFIFSMTSFILIGALISYFYRENLEEALQKVQSSFMKLKGNLANSENLPNSLPYRTTLTSELELWDSIKNRWEPILPENEFKILETLFFNGTINQQTIAEELNMSQMTVSRLVSRLESKQLLIKKRSGMSNMIILNIDRL